MTKQRFSVDLNTNWPIQQKQFCLKNTAKFVKYFCCSFCRFRFVQR